MTKPGRKQARPRGPAVVPAKRAAENSKAAPSAAAPSSANAATTMTQRRQDRAVGRRAVAEARRRQKRVRKLLLVAIALIALAAGGYFAFTRIGGSSSGDGLAATAELAQANGTPVAGGDAGVLFPDLGGGHVAQGQAVTNYNSDPPTSGQHWPVTAAWGIHAEAVPNELQVHNLEHGGIVIQYDCPSGCPVVVQELTTIVNTYPVKLLLAPRAGMRHQIVLTAWNRMITLDNVNQTLIQRFLNAYIDKGPEQIPSETQQLQDSQK